MGGFLSTDGPIYRACNIIYYLFLVNVMWIVFCLPIFTAGASTTAAFYVMGKVARGEDVSPIKDFWKSFKMNFKQGCLVGIIFIIMYAILYFNFHHLGYFGQGLIRTVFTFLQIGIAIPLVIATLYSFPILARVHIDTKKLFVSSIYIGVRHFIITIEAVIIPIGMFFVLRYVRYFNGIVFFTLGALYAYGVSFILQNTIKLYITPDSSEETRDTDDVITDVTYTELGSELNAETNIQNDIEKENNNDKYTDTQGTSGK